MSSRALTLILASLVVGGIGKGVAQAQNANRRAPTQSELVNQANAPISSLFQIRLQDSYAPAFQGQLRGQGNFFSIQVGMPLPQYRLLPFPQLSLLTIPAAVTLPLPLPFGSSTGFGDIRFVDIAVLDAGHSLLFGARTYVRLSHGQRHVLRSGQMAGWTRGGSGVCTAQLVTRNTGAKSNLVRGRFESPRSERLVSSTVYSLPARSRMVRSIRAADDF